MHGTQQFPGAKSSTTPPPISQLHRSHATVFQDTLCVYWIYPKVPPRVSESLSQLGNQKAILNGREKNKRGTGNKLN